MEQDFSCSKLGDETSSCDACAAAEVEYYFVVRSCEAAFGTFCECRIPFPSDACSQHSVVCFYVLLIAPVVTDCPLAFALLQKDLT